MKHTWNVTLLLITFFFVSQIVGLFVVNGYIDHPSTVESGEIVEKPLPFIERPEIEESIAWVPIFIAIIAGTLFALLIIKLKWYFIWKFWFFIAVLFCLSVAFFAFMNLKIAFTLALVLTILKVYRPNIYIHNLSEVFIYGGLAAIFVFFMNLKSILILLVIISLYDMFSVWKSKHMIKLAKFQAKQKLFAGVLIPYSLPEKPKVKKIEKGKKVPVAVKSAILGGGDIGFPLIFSGVVFKGLVLTNILPIAFLKTLIISITTATALLWLFIKAEKDKYYPAMPFISIGCLAGYLIIYLINLI